MNHNILKASLLKLLEDYECDRCQFAIITAYEMDGEALNGLVADIKSKGLSYIKIFGLGKDQNGKLSNVPFLVVKNSGYRGKQVLNVSEFDRCVKDLGESNGQPVHTYFDLHENEIASFLSGLKDHGFDIEYFHPDWGGVENHMHGMCKEIAWCKSL